MFYRIDGAEYTSFAFGEAAANDAAIEACGSYEPIVGVQINGEPWEVRVFDAYLVDGVMQATAGQRWPAEAVGYALPIDTDFRSFEQAAEACASVASDTDAVIVQFVDSVGELAREIEIEIVRPWAVVTDPTPNRGTVLAILAAEDDHDGIAEALKNAGLDPTSYGDAYVVERVPAGSRPGERIWR